MWPGLLHLSRRGADAHMFISARSLLPGWLEGDLTMPADWAVAGLDVGGTTINATVLDADARFLATDTAETPSGSRGRTGHSRPGHSRQRLDPGCRPVPSVGILELRSATAVAMSSRRLRRR